MENLKIALLLGLALGALSQGLSSMADLGNANNRIMMKAGK